MKSEISELVVVEEGWREDFIYPLLKPCDVHCLCNVLHISANPRFIISASQRSQLQILNPAVLSLPATQTHAPSVSTATVVLSRVTPAVVPEEEDEVLARCTT